MVPAETVAKRLLRRIIRAYKIDPNLEQEIFEAAMTMYKKQDVRLQRALKAAALYALARRGVDIAEHPIMPRHNGKYKGRASMAILVARLVSAKENRDDMDEFIRAYAYVIYIVEKRGLPRRVIEEAKEILWTARPLLRMQNEPLLLAREAIDVVMGKDNILHKHYISPRTLLYAVKRLKDSEEANA